MNKNIKKIIFVHRGTAFYPEISAYRKFFNQFKTSVVKFNELKSIDLNGAIVWMLCGCHRVGRRANAIIHDYRSLSVPPFSHVKDRLKKVFNGKPVARIFLNEEVRDNLEFRDNVPFFLLDMGIDENFFTVGRKNYLQRKMVRRSNEKWRFCFVGSIHRAKNSILLKWFSESDIRRRAELIVVGAHDPSVVRAFEGVEGITFIGPVTQSEVAIIAGSCDWGISFQPERYPWCLQTSTKMIEYAAVGLPVLANASGSNLKTAKKYGIKAWIFDGNLFAAFEENELGRKTNVDNVNFDGSIFSWDNMIRDSGIEELIYDLM